METESTQPNVNIMHNDQGIILQIPTGMNTFAIIGISDTIIEQVYEERKRRHKETLKVVKPGILTL